MLPYNPREPLFLASAPPESRVPICPICGEETDTFYKNRDNDIIGCTECIDSLDAYEYEAEQKEQENDDKKENFYD